MFFPAPAVTIELSMTRLDEKVLFGNPLLTSPVDPVGPAFIKMYVFVAVVLP